MRRCRSLEESFQPGASSVDALSPKAQTAELIDPGMRRDRSAARA